MPLDSTTRYRPIALTQSGAHTHRSNQVATLLRIFDPSVQLALWHRPGNPVIEQYLDAEHDNLGSGLRRSCTPGEHLDLSSLPAGAGREALAADIGILSELLGDLLGCDQLGVRLEVIRGAMCPRLHVDRVGIRLLCTYRGPGTEWIDDDKVDRSKLGPGANGLPDAISGLYGASTTVERVAPFDVALLKGSAWQGNAGRGVIHRSPLPEAGSLPRVLVAIDPIW